jgi:hypothetical protein
VLLRSAQPDMFGSGPAPLDPSVDRLDKLRHAPTNTTATRGRRFSWALHSSTFMAQIADHFDGANGTNVSTPGRVGSWLEWGN